MDNKKLIDEAKNLMRDYSLISEQMTKKRLQIVLRLLAQALDKEPTGDIVEFGCYIGTTSLFIRRLLDLVQNNNHMFHVYDSFEGLPPKTIKDASVAGSDFKAGELKTSKRQFIRNFKKAGLVPPVIHKSWFRDLRDKEIPDLINFALIDADFYTSIMEGLNLVWPRLMSGGTLVVDDYERSNLPGVSRAIEDFFKQTEQPANILHQQNLAIIIKS